MVAPGPKFANKTDVSPEKSRGEIERLVTKYGATKFVSGWEQAGAAVLFEMKGRRIRFSLPMPTPDDRVFKRDGAGRSRNAAQQRAAYEQAIRSSWRALVLVIKAKLEAVESGITTFETEFLAHIVLPGGGTVGEWAVPQIAAAYENGVSLPPLLPGGQG